MKRREFLSVVGGAAIAGPLAAHSQQVSRIKRVGFILGFSKSDPEALGRVEALREALQSLGWVEARNLVTEDRWSGNDTELLRRHVDELVALNPDAIVCGHTIAAQRLRRASRAIPTVFVGIADPIGSGVVSSLAKPGGNVTGFTAFEYAIGGKWLSLLKEMAPRTDRVGLIFSARTASADEVIE